MITITIAGDFAPQYRVAKLIEAEKYENIFAEIKPIINNSDYAVVNLECPVVLGDKIPIMKQGENLHCSPKAVNALKYAGFKMVTLANNHFYDFGEKGVKNTIDVCNRNSIDTVGGGLNLKDAQKFVIKKIKNKTFAFINFCETEFSIATQNLGGANPLNPVTNYYQITEAKNHADYVIVIVHGGHEYFQYPSPRMKQTYRYFVDIGADAVLNHHQHCYSGYENYKDKSIFYGLGNFCFDSNLQMDKAWYEGYMVSLHFNNENIDYQLHPYSQCNFETKPSVVLLHKDFKTSFFNNLYLINEIISDDELLDKKFNENVNKMRDQILLQFEPYSNRYLKAMRRRKIIPSLIKDEKKISMSNFIACESHRDIVLEIFKVK